MGERCEWVCAWSCLHCILTLIWLPLWLSGCDASFSLHDLECPVRKLRVGNLTQVQVAQEVCCHLLSGKGYETCENNDYSCCNAKLTYSFVGEDQEGKCTESYGPLHDCAGFTLGKEKEFTWDPNTGTCSGLTRAKRVFDAGITFFALDMFCWCCCCLGCCIARHQKKKELRWTLLPHENLELLPHS